MTGVTHDGRRWSNAEEDRVDLVDYAPRWPSMFDAEVERLRTVLTGLDLGPFRLEHFGSTAIPGITAKPIIDIARLKQELQARHPTDREAYTAGKAEFVAEIVGRAQR